jgi:small subunit ribosomal protein S24e
MELKIDRKNENELLKRTEIEFVVSSEGATPSRKEVKSAIQQSLKVDEDLIVIDRVDNMYGTTNVRGRALVYKDKENMRTVQAYKISRDKGEKGTKKEAGAKKPEAKK